jgi:hypothetical protein
LPQVRIHSRTHRGKRYQADKPIALYHGQILDGRHRYQACLAEGVEPVFFTVAEDVDPYLYVLRVHKGRRDYLDKVQQATVALLAIEGSDAWIAEREAAKEEANRARSEAAKEREREETDTGKTIFKSQVEPHLEARLEDAKPQPQPKHSDPAKKAATIAAQRIGVHPRARGRECSRFTAHHPDWGTDWGTATARPAWK